MHCVISGLTDAIMSAEVSVEFEKRIYMTTLQYQVPEGDVITI